MGNDARWTNKETDKNEMTEKTQQQTTIDNKAGRDKSKYISERSETQKIPGQNQT